MAKVIREKRAYEKKVRDWVVGMLEREQGRYLVELVGRYPDTKLVIDGPGLATGRPCHWEFELWRGWVYEDLGGARAEDVGVLIWANLDQ